MKPLDIEEVHGQTHIQLIRSRFLLLHCAVVICFLVIYNFVNILFINSSLIHVNVCVYKVF